MIPLCIGNRTFHFSFILRRNKVLAAGHNSYTKTHGFAIRNNIEHGFMHSEISALKSFQFSLNELSGTTLVNIRLSKCGEYLMMARPCKRCYHVINQLNFSEIWFSTENGLRKL